jgi:hypothetical protein
MFFFVIQKILSKFVLNFKDYIDEKIFIYNYLRHFISIL